MKHCIPLLIACLLPVACKNVPKESETAPTGWSPLSMEALAEGKDKPDFRKHVWPILEAKCVACHKGGSAPLGFRLDSRQEAFASGLNGPRIIPGNPAASRLVQLTSAHKNMRMMPVVGEQVTEEELAILRTWIAQGAAWPR